jgi:hypothetical protein
LFFIFTIFDLRSAQQAKYQGFWNIFQVAPPNGAGTYFRVLHGTAWAQVAIRIVPWNILEWAMWHGLA